jgi:UDPglucose 6-dehydrogenase
MVAVIGLGWVGKSMLELFPDSVIYDEPMGIGNKATVNQCDVAFVCVPTPNNPDGSLNTDIVEDVISWCETPLIVIRSTVNPGFTNQMIMKYDRCIVFQPEYLGETVDHPMISPKGRPFMIIGGNPVERRELIDVYTKAYNANVTIKQVTAYEAEVIKLSENRAIAYKVAQCQELYDACEKHGIDYYTIRDAVYGDDPRFNLWWTFIYPEARGFNSKCIPKDVYAWNVWAGKPELTDTLLKYNDRLIHDTLS